MLRARRVSEYPWTALDRLEARLERLMRSARRGLELGVEPAAFARALSSLVGAELELHVLSVDDRQPETPLVRVGFGVQGRGERVVVGLDPALAGALLAKLLRRPVPLVRSDASFDETLVGALSALLLEAARRTEPSRALVPRDADVSQGSAVVHSTVLLEGRPYVAALWLSVSPLEQHREMLALESLWHAELSLPLVVAESLGRPRELARLEPGAAWCPGAGWHLDSALEGHGILVAPESERGLSVEVGRAGRIVLREPTTALLAAPDSMATDSDESPEPSTLPQAVLDAPLVVRVELGAISMKAREWASLRPGDVIETGRRIAEPVLLRAGGRVLARGELVNVEGELGVRVTDLVNEDEP
jgi:flagellar motor switch/type III secretory pathway protein FliN